LVGGCGGEFAAVRGARHSTLASFFWIHGRAVATALRAELIRQSRALLANVKELEKSTPERDLIVPDIAQSLQVLPHVTDKFGLLSGQTIEAVIDAYIVIEQYWSKLIIDGGEAIQMSSGGRRYVKIDSTKVSRLRGANLGVNDVIQKAIKQLSAE